MGAVSHPLMSLGKFLRQGWNVRREDGEMFIQHPSGAAVPIRLERNSLVMDVHVCMIKDNTEEEKQGDEARICALRGFLSRELGELERSPGWHVLPNGVVVYSDSVALNFLDPRNNFDVEWPSRMTLMKLNNGSGQWEQVENVEDYRNTEQPYRKLTPESQPQRTLTFVAPRQLQNYFAPNSEVPISMFPRMGGEIEAWPDSEDEVAEFQPEDAGAGGEAPGQLEPAFQDEDELEVTIDEEVLNSTTKLKTLQEWCRKLGMATSGGKTKCLRRLRSYRVVEEQKMAVEVSRKMYEEGKREAVALPVPKLPSKTEQEIHNLTHIPFAPWCQCCVATRAKEDARKEEARGDVTDRGKPIISFDYGYTFMEEEEEEKQ